MSHRYIRSALAFLAAICAATSSTALAQSSPSPYTAATRYDVFGRVVGTILPDPDDTGPLHYAATRNSYDAAGRLTKTETGELADWKSDSVLPAAWGGDFKVLSLVEFTYDDFNSKLTEKVTGSNGVTLDAVATSLTQYSYDAVGRLECTAVRMNPAIYGALPLSACTLGAEGTNGPDRITRTIYNPGGQVLQLRKAVETDLEQAYVTYSYAANGKPQYTIDANGNRAEFTYDGYDRQARWYFPSKTMPTGFNPATPATALASAGAVDSADYEEYGYDANGNRTSLRKRDGSIIAYAYDALNRMTVKDIPFRTGLHPDFRKDVYYSYDARGLQTAARFDNPATGEGVFDSYDGLGRLTQATVNLDGNVRDLTYEYDKNGNRLWIRHGIGSGPAFWTDFDGLDRPIKFRRSTVDLLSVVYNNRGLSEDITRPNTALEQHYAYDTVGRLATSEFLKSGITDSTKVLWSFTRNPASQLVSESWNNDSYAWNAHTVSETNYTVNGLNQYVTAGAEGFCYDANGNLTRDDLYAYQYDIENRMVEMRVKQGGTCPTLTTGYAGNLRAQLRYDPLGRLHEAKKYTGTSVLAGTTQFQYDGDALVLEYDGTGAITNRYVHGNDAGADDPLVWYLGSGFGINNARYLYSDPRGSIVLAKRSDGLTIALNSYDEWGVPGSANAGRFQYTGQAWLEELGMYYYKARIYSPRLGRFMQTDPIGYEDQVNLYAYVGNDPVNETDFSGKCPQCAGAVIGAATGAGLDYGVQVLGNLAEGKSLGDSLTDVDGKSIAISAVGGAIAGATGVGATTLVGKALKAERAAVRAQNATTKAKAATSGSRRAIRTGQQARRAQREATSTRSSIRRGAAGAAAIQAGKEAAKRVEPPKKEDEKPR